MSEGVANLDTSTFLESLNPNRVQAIEVHCPYCLIGTATTTVTGPTLVTVGTQQTIDMRPKQCGQCKRYFRLGYRQQFVGIQMEG